MEEISLAVFDHEQPATERLKQLIAEFERLHPSIYVRLEVLPPWAMGWSRMIEIALYHSGPDISEVGSTWVGDLARMMALRPFTQQEIEHITAGEKLFRSVWSEPGMEPGKRIVYSIPWTADVRVVCYRRDLLKKAGVEEAGAFQSAERFDQTLAALKEAKIPVPLLLPTQRSSLTLHNLASWVWGAGGDFLTPDGKDVAFDQPRAIEGSKQYFRLSRYLDDQAYSLGESDINTWFWLGKAAVALSGYWLLSSDQMMPEVRENLGVAPMPGVPFVGGNDLVIWQHSRNEAAAVELVRFLHSSEAASVLCPQFGLPVAENMWDQPPYVDSAYAVLRQFLQSGRSFSGQLWGLVEKRLVDALAGIWAEVRGKDISQIDEIVETQLSGLARRLRLSLES